MRQHCAQCLTEILATGRQAPTGEMLCHPCYSALWGPQATEELRSLVRLHTGRRATNGRVVPQQA
jgi:recombinational DNA repair protein (RecF pathway)